MKRKLVTLVALALVLASSAYAGNLTVKRYVLFNGSNTDSTEQASPWFPVKGASKVVFRTWSTHAAFTVSGADTAFSDSLITFNVFLSDSVSFIARDSSGTIVTARSSYTSPGVSPPPFPMCADSVLVPVTATGDTTSTWTRAYGFAINKELRAPANGSGLLTYVVPVVQGSATLPNATVTGIGKGYMRVRFTPLRRLIQVDTKVCTGTFCNRVNGLKGFRMVAEVTFDNQ